MKTQALPAIAILGAGSWGTAIALYLARRGQKVKIWSVEPAEITALLQDKANTRYLPGFPLPENLQPVADLQEALADVQDVIVVVPSIGFRTTMTLLKSHLSKNKRIISATKGLDETTGQLPNEIAEEILGKSYPFAALSGPSFAREVAAGLPTCVMVASRYSDFLADITERFNSPLFRVYPSEDVIGVEFGGVAKNVIAIATGIVDGMALGTNARSALITQGLAEIIRLGTALGGQLTTFIGLSGLGDLILTCSDDQSRNRRLGLALGKGLTIQQAEQQIGQAIEGKRNAELVLMLAKRHQIAMPICTMVYDILQNKQSAQTMIKHLLNTW